MLNHSTWRLNDSTFRLNRRRTCQDRGEAGMLEAQLARFAAKLACWRRNLPGSRRSWHVGGATCQVRGEAGMLKAEPARIVAKLACWAGTCQDRGDIPLRVQPKLLRAIE